MLKNFQREARPVGKVMADSQILRFWLIWLRFGILAIFQSAALSGRNWKFLKGVNDLINTQPVCKVRARKSEATRNQEGAPDRQLLDPGFGNTHMHTKKFP